jgi:hypothetical protein
MVGDLDNVESPKRFKTQNSSKLDADTLETET